jgi:hypothetical protein
MLRTKKQNNKTDYGKGTTQTNTTVRNVWRTRVRLIVKIIASLEKGVGTCTRNKGNISHVSNTNRDISIYDPCIHQVCYVGSAFHASRMSETDSLNQMKSASYKRERESARKNS